MTNSTKAWTASWAVTGSAIAVIVVAVLVTPTKTPISSQSTGGQIKITQKNIPSEPETKAEPEPKAPTKPKIGDGVFIGYWAYSCEGARWKKSIGSGYTIKYPDAEFLIIDLVIRNDDKTASTLPPVKLVDSQGREYDASSDSIYLDNSFGIWKKVNPGVTSRGYIAFDVPHGTYALKLSGGFTSGKSELVDLR